jgi:prophage regulatory protein
MNSQTILRKQEVLRRIGVSASTLWRMEREGEFPSPVRISTNRVGWVETEIDEWIQARIEQRGGER